MGQSPKRLIYQVAVGETPPFYDICINSAVDYASRIHADHFVLREPILRIAPRNSARSENALRLGYLPIYEKENAFACLQEYDQVLVLDADVYVRPEAPDIFSVSSAPFAGVVERDMPLNVQYREKVRKHSFGQFDNLRDVEWKWDERGAQYFNMGVMLLHQNILPFLSEDSPSQFLRRPEFERFINGDGHWRWSTDQTLLNWWLKKAAITTHCIDWNWNALYGAVQDVSEAHFVHFFLSAKLPRKGLEIPEIIRGL